MTEDNNILQLQNLWLGYKPGNFLVESVNTSLKAGEMIALAGRNGTGKSTLLRTISGVQKIVKGDVMLYNKPITSYKANELALKLSFVGTAANLSGNLTVFETVALGRHPYTNWWGSLKTSDIEKIEESIHFVEMNAHINSRIDRLSDGERQRVMIATALAQDTSLIILDEPTAFLDIPNRIGIVEVLYRLKMAGKSVIFSTHDFDTVFTFADKLWVIDDKTLKQGAPEDLGIQGVFDHLFKNSNVLFDADVLRFKRIIHVEKSIVIKQISHLHYNWTCKAMERIGYKVVSSGNKSDPEITLGEEAAGSAWLLRELDNIKPFQTLYELTRYLTRIR